TTPRWAQASASAGDPPLRLHDSFNRRSKGMTVNTKNLRVSLLASVIAAAVAGPAFAAGQAPLEVRPMPAPAAEADTGTRLIVKYRDKRAAPAVKAQSVQAAATRALGSRLVRNSAAAGATAPEARHVRTMSI